jgi:hypothetical protein
MTDTLPPPQCSHGVTISLIGEAGAVQPPHLGRLRFAHRSGGLRPEPATLSQPFGRSSHIAGELQ